MISTFEDDNQNIERIVLSTTTRDDEEWGEWDDYLYFPGEAERKRLNAILGGDFCYSDDDEIMDNLDNFIKCQEERDAIIKDLIKKIVNDFDSDLDLATEAEIDLYLFNHPDIKEPVDTSMVYEKCFKTLFSERFPKVKLKLSICTLNDYCYCIGDCCSVKALYTFYKIFSSDKFESSNQLEAWEQPNNHVEGHGNSYDSIDLIGDELMRERLRTFNDAPLYANWLISKEVVDKILDFGDSFYDTAIEDASVYNPDDALSDAAHNLFVSHKCMFERCETTYLVIFIGSNFQNKAKLFKSAKSILRNKFKSIFPDEDVKIRVGIAHDSDKVGECDLSLYAFCC